MPARNIARRARWTPLPDAFMGRLHEHFDARRLREERLPGAAVGVVTRAGLAWAQP